MLLAIAVVLLYRTPFRASDLETVPDSVEYAVGALQLHDTGRYELIVQSRPFPPRYAPWFSAIFLLPVYALIGDDPGNGILPVTLAGIAGIGFAWSLGRRVSGVAGGALAAIAVLALPTYGYWSGQIMTDVPCTTLMLASCVLYLKMRSHPRSIHQLLGAGILVALAAMFRPVFAAMIGPFLLLVLRERKNVLFAGAALLFPLLLGKAATLFYNARTFGSPTRNGYAFWAPVPYDYPSLTFSLSNSASTLWALFFGTPLPWMILAALIAAFLTKSRSPVSGNGEALRDIVTFVILTSAPIFLFHLVYFFTDDRFHLGMLAGTAVIAGAATGRLFSSRWNGIFRLLLPTLLVFAIIWRILLPEPAPRRRLAADRLLAQTPANAIIISRIDPVYLGRLVARNSGRLIVPISRRVEYASKLVARTRIKNPQPPPRNWRDQRSEGLIRGGAEEAVSFVAEERLSELAAEAAKGRPIFLESSALVGPRDGDIVKQLRQTFLFVERAPDLYELQSL